MARKLQPDTIRVNLDVNASKAQQEIRKLSQSNRELTKANKEYRLERLRLMAADGDHAKEIAQLDEAMAANYVQIRKNTKEIRRLESSISNSDKTMGQLRKQLKRLRRELDNTSKSSDPKRYAKLSRAIIDTKRAMSELEGPTEEVKKGFLSLSNLKATVVGFFMAVGAAILSFFTNALKGAITTIMEFEKANSNLAAVLGSTKAGIKDLTDEARRLGAATSYTAAQVTQLQTELAKLGFDKEQIKAMEEGVLKFAQAVDTDLGSAAAFAGASMRIFGIEAEKVEGMLASLAVGTTKSALSFSYLQNSMATIGPVANAFGFSIEETIALLGNLANAGFDASSAATASRNILLNLADSNGKLAKALGAPIKNLDDLVAGLKKLNDEGIDLATALELTDKRSVSAFSKFLAGADSVAELRDSVSGCTGAFNSMYDEMSDNASTAFDILQSTIEGVIMRFYKARGAIKAAIEAVTACVEWIGKMIDVAGRMSGLIITGAKAWLTYKAAVLAANVAGRLKVATLGLLTSGVGRNRLAVIAASLTTTKWTKALSLLWKTLRLNPLGLVITAVTMLLPLLDKILFKSREVAASQKALIETGKESARMYGEEKARIESLVMVAENENVSLTRRKKAVQELNRIIPGYNAQIDATTGKYKASTEQLREYLALVEKEMRYKANKDKLEQLINAEEQAHHNKDEVEIAQNEIIRNRQAQIDQTQSQAGTYDGAGSYAGMLGMPTQRYGKIKALQNDIRNANETIKAAHVAYDNAKALTDKFRNYIEEGLKNGTMVAEAVAENTSEAVSVPAAAAVDAAVKAKAAVEKSVKDTDDLLKSEVRSIQDSYNDRMAAIDAFYERQKLVMEQSVADGKVTREAADIYELNADRQHHAELLEESRRFAADLEALYEAEPEKYGELLDDIYASVSGKITGYQNQILTDTGKWAEKMRAMTRKGAGPESLAEAAAARKASIAAEYDAVIAIARASGEETVELEKEKARRLEEVDSELSRKTLERKKELGLANWEDEYMLEMSNLEKLYAAGIISLEEYEEMKFRLKVKWADKYFQYYADLSSSMFSAIQEAEIARSDAKYDVLIQQAKNNGEDTAALEEEKENKKLEIQKKYADVDFAIKISEIIANTAVAIMTGFKQLGPIAGAVAAAMLTATGAAQVASAKAERDKIKNMEPGRTAGASKEKATAQRVLSGYSEGGYTGDGDRYEVAGVVHRGEYVVPKPIMTNPRVIDAVGTIEAIRRHRSGYVASSRTEPHGYAEGGYTTSLRHDTPAMYGEFAEAAHELRMALKNLRAYVVYKDIEDAGETMDRARAPFTRKNNRPI